MKICRLIIGIVNTLLGIAMIVGAFYFFLEEDEAMIIAYASLLVALLISAIVVSCGVYGIISITNKDKKND